MHLYLASNIAALGVLKRAEHPDGVKSSETGGRAPRELAALVEHWSPCLEF